MNQGDEIEVKKDKFKEFDERKIVWTLIIEKCQK